MDPEAAALPTRAMPRGRVHGWREAGLVFACTLGNFLCVTPAVTAVFGLFLVPISMEFDWPRARVASGLAILTLTNAVFFPVVGRLADRFGTRPVVLAGNVMLGLAIIALSHAPARLFVYDGLFAIVGLAGAASSGMLFTKIISQNFTDRRGLWMGFTAGIGNGAGSAVMPLIAGLILNDSGWRGAFRDIGLLVLLGFPLLLLLLRDMKQAGGGVPASMIGSGAHDYVDYSGDMTVWQAVRTGQFWMILGAIALCGGCMIAVFAHIVPILTDAGYSVHRATIVLSVFALSCAAWQSMVGWLLDRTPSPRATAPFYLLAVIGLLIVQHGGGFVWMLAAGAMLGVALGTEFGMLGYLISRYFGVRSFGAISGIMFAAVLLSQALAPFLMDVAFDRTGSYALPLRGIEVAMTLAAITIGLLRPYPFPLRHS